MATCLIDTIEGRNVATADTPGAFLYKQPWTMTCGSSSKARWSTFYWNWIQRDTWYLRYVCHYKGRKFLPAVRKGGEDDLWLLVVSGVLRLDRLYRFISSSAIFSGELLNEDMGFPRRQSTTSDIKKMII